MQETQEIRFWSLGREDSLESEMATHSSILSWEIPWTEEPGMLHSMGSQRVRYDRATYHARTHELLKTVPRVSWRNRSVSWLRQRSCKSARPVKLQRTEAYIRKQTSTYQAGDVPLWLIDFINDNFLIVLLYDNYARYYHKWETGKVYTRSLLFLTTAHESTMISK